MNNNSDNLHDAVEKLTEKINDIQSHLQSDKLQGKKWLRTEELMEYLSISRSQLHKLKSNGTIPVSKIGGTNYYEREKVDEILTANQTGVGI